MNQESAFNPEQFLEGLEVQGANSTTIPLVPEGEYPAVIKEYKGRTGVDKHGKPYVGVDISWEISGATPLPDGRMLSEVIGGLPKTVVRQSFLLDYENGVLQMGEGRNVQLGRLRRALNMNDPAVPFRFGNIKGASARITVAHRVDKEDASLIYQDVKGVTQL